MHPVPPRLATALLRRWLSEEDFEAISGDLEELFQLEAPRRRDRARLWYWQQVASVLAARAFSTTSLQPDTETRTMATLGRDLAYACRMLRKQPGFTITTVLTLALGIGANVAVFSLVNAVLFKQLPFADPDRLMVVHLLAPDREAAGTLRPVVWSYPKYVFFRDHQTVFESTAIFSDNEWSLTGVAAPERLSGEFVEATYLPTLGVTPQIGRDFTREETAAPDSARIVMIANSLWQRRFGSDPSVVGQTLGLNGVPYTIIGILPPAFRGLTGQAEVLVPVTTLSAADLGEAWNHSYRQVARRKPDVTPAQAAAAVTLLGAQVHAQYPTPPGSVARAGDVWSALAVPLNDERVNPLIRRSVLMMLVVVAAVLLIVCVNLTNLMLVRMLAQQRDVAIRLALGASRARIIRQLMTESFVIAVLGAVAGLVVAYGAVAGGYALLPDLRMVLPGQTGGLTRVGLSTLGLDGATLLFTIGIVSVTALLFGFGPAWRASRRDLTATIKAGSAGAVSQGATTLGVRALLIMGELALALVLLTAGGLMLKSAARLQTTELGFRPQALLTVRLALPAPKYDRPRATQLLVDLIERLKRQPGVESVAYGSCPPISGYCNTTSGKIVGKEYAPGTSPAVGVYWASPSLFDVLGVRLIRGRVFNDGDRLGQPKVVVINETAARTLWGSEDPIGKRIAVGQGGFNDGADVVGVVGDVRYGAVELSMRPDVYVPLLQSGRTTGIIFLRSRIPPTQLIPSIRAELRALDADVPLIDVKSMDQRYGDATWRTRASAWLLGVFAILALTLAAIGIYGVMSQGVAQRAREIGVRLALGADRADILRLILGRALVISVVGVVLGVALAIPSMRLLSSLLYDVAPNDPLVLGTLATALFAVGIIASYLPARRATQVDPLTTLRAE
jgi:putative ABC transport system permease protein